MSQQKRDEEKRRRERDRKTKGTSIMVGKVNAYFSNSYKIWANGGFAWTYYYLSSVLAQTLFFTFLL